MTEPLVSPEADRVRAHSPEEADARVDEQARQRVARAAAEGRAAIERRLEELDREWDIEQWLQVNAASLALSGVGLAAARGSRRWLALPGVVLPFLVQHAVQGWCPPVPLFRRLGVRTQQEIDAERYALKALRGDFDGVARDARRVLSAARA